MTAAGGAANTEGTALDGVAGHALCYGNYDSARRRYFVITGLSKGHYQASRVRHLEINSIQLIKLAGWTLTTVYISLNQLFHADNEWHTGLLYTEVFDQLGSGWRSKGEVSVHLSGVGVN